MAKKKFGGWEARAPSLKVCCICERTLGTDIRIEARPTGTGKRLQQWPYCLACWNDYQELYGPDRMAVDCAPWLRHHPIEDDCDPYAEEEGWLQKLKKKSVDGKEFE